MVGLGQQVPLGRGALKATRLWIWSALVILAVHGAVDVKTVEFPTIIDGTFSREGLSWRSRDANQSNELPTFAQAKPAKARSLAELPKNFDWSNVGGINYLTGSWNQHIPQYCGSCYLHASLAAAQDRIKVAKAAKGPDVMLARQTVLNCVASVVGADKGGESDGCGGGTSLDVYRYMHDVGVPDETCSQYVAKETAQCDAQAVCKNCMVTEDDSGRKYQCWPVEDFVTYRIPEFGKLPMSETSIMSEILHAGPVACSIATSPEFDYDYLGGVWTQNGTSKELDHIVEITGWGVTRTGTKFWQVRNSWGTYWGNQGFFKILRGENVMMIESDCWFVRVDWSDEDRVRSGELVGGMFGLRERPVDRQLEDLDFEIALDGAESREFVDQAKDRMAARGRPAATPPLGSLASHLTSLSFGCALGVVLHALFTTVRTRRRTYLPMD